MRGTLGEATLAAVLELPDIAFVIPNKHDLPINLRPFGFDGAVTVFQTANEPYGRIEATIGRRR